MCSRCVFAVAGETVISSAISRTDRPSAGVGQDLDLAPAQRAQAQLSTTPREDPADRAADVRAGFDQRLAQLCSRAAVQLDDRQHVL